MISILRLSFVKPVVLDSSSSVAASWFFIRFSITVGKVLGEKDSNSKSSVPTDVSHETISYNGFFFIVSTNLIRAYPYLKCLSCTQKVIIPPKHPLALPLLPPM